MFGGTVNFAALVVGAVKAQKSGSAIGPKTSIDSVTGSTNG